MDILRVEHVSKHYAGHKALDDVSLSIPRGSVYGLLGPNGAGKTTLIRIVNRITAPATGRVWFDGHEIAPDDVRRIGYLPEERGLYKKMKVGEQALFFARLKGLSRQDAMLRLREWFERFGIEAWWNRRVEELSKGMAPDRSAARPRSDRAAPCGQRSSSGRSTPGRTSPRPTGYTAACCPGSRRSS